MLTRAQVAARLGKSIATVRRMEGIVLHPRKGADGVHWFCQSEVAAVERAPRSPVRSFELALRRGRDEDERPAESHQRVAAIERALARADNADRALKRLSAEHDELREAVVIFVESLVYEIGPTMPRSVIDLIDELAELAHGCTDSERG